MDLVPGGELPHEIVNDTGHGPAVHGPNRKLGHGDIQGHTAHGLPAGFPQKGRPGKAPRHIRVVVADRLQDSA